MSLLSPGGTAPNWKVSVWAAAAPALGAWARSLTVTPGVISFGYLFSRIHTGRFGFGEVRVVEADVERALSEPVAVTPALVLAGVDRHREVGDRLVADVLDRELEVAGFGEHSGGSGNFAFATCTGKLPDGSVASWRSPPPQAETPDARASAASPVAILAAAPRSRCLPALVPLSPKARRNIPPAAGSNRRLDRANAGSSAPNALGGGGEQPHANTLLSAARPACGAEEKMVRTVADRAFLPAKSCSSRWGT